jgi:hypothetical protein
MVISFVTIQVCIKIVQKLPHKEDFETVQFFVAVLSQENESILGFAIPKP